jgi:hypothetical protein
MNADNFSCFVIGVHLRSSAAIYSAIPYCTSFGSELDTNSLKSCFSLAWESLSM